MYKRQVYVHPEQTQKIVRTWIAGKYQQRKFLFGWMPPHPTFFVRRHVYEHLGAVSYTHLDVYKRQVYVYPPVVADSPPLVQYQVLVGVM